MIKLTLRCCQYAAALVSQIRPKWHPDVGSPGDKLSLTTERKEKNGQAIRNGGALTFDPSITSDEPLEEAFRAFLSPETHDHPPAIR